jgi:cytolysin-activating lysine-acyltransferase
MDEGEYHKQMGRVAVAMTRSDNYCHYPIACLAVWIRPPVLLEQIHFFSDRSGALAGYMTWAFLADDVERRLLTDPDVLLHISEWNEGDTLWIMDFVAFRGHLRSCLMEAATLFPGHAFASSLRRRDDGSVRKVSRWPLKKYLQSRTLQGH